jgi:hypothetical protein
LGRQFKNQKKEKRSQTTTTEQQSEDRRPSLSGFYNSIIFLMVYDFKKIVQQSINKYKQNKFNKMASQQQQQQQQQQQMHQQQQMQQQMQQQQHQHQQPSYGNGNQNPHNQISMASLDGTRSYVTARTAATQSLAGTANGDNATVGTNGGGSINGGGGSVMGNNTMMLAQPTPAKHPSFYTACGCIECYKPSRENLKYDYTYDDVSGKKPAQAYPRIRERGEFYIDSFNGEPWSCSFGTAEKVCRVKQ